MSWGRRIGVGVVALSLAAALGGGASGRSALGTPGVAGPRSGAVVEELPAFVWSAVSGAESYEFQLSADRGFRSIVFSESTGNAAATMTKAIPDGSYWWHVRAISKSGQISGWSSPRSLRKAWTGSPRLLSPVRGKKVDFPSTPLTLSWTAVPRAATYLVSIATDESLSSLVGGRAVETAAVSASPQLTPGSKSKTYYWAITPVDAEGNKGKQSRVEHFEWAWRSTTKVRWDDLRKEDETVDPQFSWDPVPGAARYEVEINSSQPPDWAPSSRVCCKKTVVGTTFSPTQIFADNTYYWRVRALDVNDNAGVWNYPEPSQLALHKVFDKQADLGRASVSNLHMQGDPTRVPIAVWDPVPGASEYLIQVAGYVPSAGVCDWGSRSTIEVETPNVYWTPLANTSSSEPYPANVKPRKSGALIPGVSYCVRVRAGSDKDTEGDLVYGDFAYINGPDSAAFRYAGPPCPTSCGGGRHLDGGSYGLPGQGFQTIRTPLLTWQPSAGASWWVLVAKDPQFHTVVDYAFTVIPAYAPRITFSDEATHYYWTVLPSPNLNGSFTSGDPLGGAAATFDKRSIVPSLATPRPGASVTLAPRFQWTPVEGARTYHFEVSPDKDFGKLLDDVETDSVAYTSNTSYPPDVALYWRVRAETSDKVALGWSETRTFKYHLSAPAPSRRPDKSDFLPIFRWTPITGAISYDFHLDYPSGRSGDHGGLPSSAISWIKFSGLGVWHWRVRANYPSARGQIHGPWSSLIRFTKTLGTPTGLRTSAARGRLVVAWSPKLGAAQYDVEISSTPDFHRSVRGTTSLTTFAPDKMPRARRGEGSTFYWRVAADDNGGNTGDWSRVVRFSLR